MRLAAPVHARHPRNRQRNRFGAFTLDVLALCLWRDPIAAAAAGSAYLLRYAVGPAAGGIVIGAGGYAALATASVAVTVVAWALTVAVCRRLGESARVTVPADV